MDEETSFVVFEDVVIPESVLLKLERTQGYGKVSGLDDEEMADPDELERQVVRAELEPLLLLPSQARHDGIRLAVDEDGVAWGAFATVDFERGKQEFDGARYKAEKLREKLKDLVILMDIVRQRLPRKATAIILKYVRMGIIGLEHVMDFDMWALARMYMRARELRRQIKELEDVSFRRQRRHQEAWLGS